MESVGGGGEFKRSLQILNRSNKNNKNNNKKLIERAGRLQ